MSVCCVDVFFPGCSFPYAETSYLVDYRDRMRPYSYGYSAQVAQRITNMVMLPIIASMDVVYHTTHFLWKTPVAALNLSIKSISGFDCLEYEFSAKELLEHAAKVVICSIILVASLTLGLIDPDSVFDLSVRLGLRKQMGRILYERLKNCIPSGASVEY